MGASSSNPPTGPLSEDTGRDLVTQVARLARAIEVHNRKRSEDDDRERREATYAPAIRYADAESINPPPHHVPRNLSWHEKVREKKVSLSSATGVGVIGCILIELIQAFITGRLKF
jgi:hypothetical protein